MLLNFGKLYAELFKYQNKKTDIFPMSVFGFAAFRLVYKERFAVPRPMIRTIWLIIEYKFLKPYFPHR